MKAINGEKYLLIGKFLISLKEGQSLFSYGSLNMSKFRIYVLTAEALRLKVGEIV